jgi:hypothetical protein
MWITPLSFTAGGEAVQLGQSEPLPLPPWSGVPVALQMEVDGPTLALAVGMQEAGTLHARDEAGASVCCAAIVDPQGCHSCETDSVLILVQCGPFDRDEAD